jgi:hypothetical protein
MASSVRAGERRLDEIAGAGRPPRKLRMWLLGLALFALFAGVLGYLVGNEVQVNTQFDQAHATLDLTRHHFTLAVNDLVAVRRDLHGADAQVDADSTALAKDTAQLKVVQAQLVQAQATVTQQGSDISDLQTCLGGVQQALNALSVGDQVQGVDQLDAVSTPCQNAAASSG